MVAVGRLLRCAVLGVWACGPTAWGQGQDERPVPRDYRGVQKRVDGIFVTPVANAPFTATVEIVSHERLPDGTEHVVKTTNHVARGYTGRIYNERRALVPGSYQGEPRLLSAHIYDPETRMSVFLDPMTRLAREQILTPRPVLPGTARRVPTVAGVVESDLGTQMLDGVLLQGLRKTRTVPASMSGTGKELVVVDEYWYSKDLALDMIIRHEDPRTGEQMVAVTSVQRAEPAATLFQVPPAYKVVDETPPSQQQVGVQ